MSSDLPRGLSNQKIAELMTKKSTRAPRSSNTTTGIGNKKVNLEVRDFTTWFALPHHILGRDGMELATCENPDCIDTRDKSRGQTCVDIHGTWICRICFLGGYLVKNPAQGGLTPQAR